MKKSISVLHGALKDGHIYMVDLDTWFFVDYDINSGKHAVLADLQRKDIPAMCWFVKVLVYENSFVCVQRNSKEIVIYSPEGEVTRFGEEYEFGVDVDLKYVDAHIYDDKLFMMPGNSDGVISIFDLKNKVYLDDFCFNQELKRVEGIGEKRRINKWLFDSNSHIAKTILRDTNAIVAVDFGKLEVSVQHIDYVAKFLGGSFYRPMIAVEPAGQEYIIYNGGKWSRRIPPQRYEMKDEYSSGIQRMFQHKDYEVVIPTRNDRMDIFNRDGSHNKTILFPEESKGKYEVRGSDVASNSYVVEDGIVYILPFSGTGITICDIEKGEVRFQPIGIDGKCLINKQYKVHGLIQESDRYVLNDFVEYVGGK